MLSIPFRSRDTRELAWQYVQQNWDKVKGQTTTSSGSYLVGAAGSFCSAEARDQVVTFYGSHKVASTERALKRATDQINDCIEFRANQEGNLKEWLAKQQ
jgi:endonuclease IV